MSFSFWNPLETVLNCLPTWLYEYNSSAAVDAPSQSPQTNLQTERSPEHEVREEMHATSERNGACDGAEVRVVPAISYYAVAFVRDAPFENDPAPLFVFETLQEVLTTCRKYKSTHLRWKRFSTRAEAEKFSVENDAEEQAAIDEVMPFEALTPKELAQLRRFIQDGDIEEVHRLIDNNPRFIIGNRDNPTILQEELGYSAFHVAAEFNRGEIMKLILERLRSPSYFRRLYPEDDDQLIWDRIAYIVEMYLNMPDGSKKSETALHFAAKFGSVSCAEFLVEQKECDKDARNSQKQGAEDIICEIRGSRCEGFRIRRLFKQNFVIPIVRSPSGSKKPHILPPVTFRKLRRMLSSSEQFCRSLSGFLGPSTSLRATKIIEDIQDGWHAPENTKLTKHGSQNGVETFVRRVARAHEVPFRQNWSFLGCALDISSESGLVVLDAYFRRRNFIHGDTPSKSDYKVWCALEPFLIEIMEDNCFLNVKRWIFTMREFNISEMRAWKRPPKELSCFARPECGADETLIGLVKKFAADGGH